MQQVFYIEDPTVKDVHFVVKKMANDQFSEVEDKSSAVDDVSDTGYLARGEIPTVNDISWSRDDIPMKKILVSPDEE